MSKSSYKIYKTGELASQGNHGFLVEKYIWKLATQGHHIFLGEKKSFEDM